MLPDLLASSKSKIERADRHIQDVATQAHSFFGTEPYPIHTYLDVEGPKQWVKVKLTRAIPASVYSTIGDALSNTRSSLDHLAGALAVKNGHPASAANFPITENQEKFEGKGIQRIEQILGKDAWEMICGLKPYRGGNDLLWSLNTLRKTDIHETVVPVASAVFNASWTMRIRTVDASSRIEMPVPASFDENMVARIVGLPTSATVFNGDFQVALDVVFRNVQPVQGQPVVAVLQQFLDFARRTVSLFEERFFL